MEEAALLRTAIEEGTDSAKHTKRRRRRKVRVLRGVSVTPVDSYAAVAQLYSALLPPIKLSHSTATSTSSITPCRPPQRAKRADHTMPPVALHLPSPSSMYLPQALCSPPHVRQHRAKHVDLPDTAVGLSEGMLSPQELHDLSAEGTVARYVSPLTTPNRLISYIEHLRQKENEGLARPQVCPSTRRLRSVVDIKKCQQVQQVYGHIPNTLRSFAQEDLKRSRRQQSCR
eukprot:GILJ01005165.1.p1 GENE.GILJ01005165.1~~GILJ01005165.1.p1  ORF type:complete len:241 (-),score=20.27 GILJ01005165.1:183-869(-)